MLSVCKSDRISKVLREANLNSDCDWVERARVAFSLGHVDSLSLVLSLVDISICSVWFRHRPNPRNYLFAIYPLQRLKKLERQEKSWSSLTTQYSPTGLIYLF